MHSHTQAHTTMNFADLNADLSDRIATYLGNVIAGLANNDDFEQPDVRYDDHAERVVVTTTHKDSRTKVHHGFGDEKIVLGFARNGDAWMQDLRYDTPYWRIPDLVHTNCEAELA